MRTHTLSRTVAAIAITGIALTACSNGDTSVSAPPTDTNTDGSASTRPADQDFTDQERADMLLGSTMAQAENLAIEFGWSVRVGRIDEESFALTEDYNIGRITIELDTLDGDAPVVTKVIIEAEGGPVSYEA